MSALFQGIDVTPLQNVFYRGQKVLSQSPDSVAVWIMAL